MVTGISSVNPEFPHEFLEGTFWLTLTGKKLWGTTSAVIQIPRERVRNVLSPPDAQVCFFMSPSAGRRWHWGYIRHIVQGAGAHQVVSVSPRPGLRSQACEALLWGCCRHKNFCRKVSLCCWGHCWHVAQQHVHWSWVSGGLVPWQSGLLCPP